MPQLLGGTRRRVLLRLRQRRIHPEDLSARHYFRELADEIATFHERFKTLPTLRRLLIPGS